MQEVIDLVDPHTLMSHYNFIKRYKPEMIQNGFKREDAADLRTEELLYDTTLSCNPDLAKLVMEGTDEKGNLVTLYPVAALDMFHAAHSRDGRMMLRYKNIK